MSQLSELAIMSMLNDRLGGVSTSVKDLILDYAGFPDPTDPFTITNYQLTTQTIVSELSGVHFNDFTMDAKKFAEGILKLLQSTNALGVTGLRRISSKRFQIEVIDSVEGPTVATTSSSVSNRN